jgi:hypothetical protein
MAARGRGARGRRSGRGGLEWTDIISAGGKQGGGASGIFGRCDSDRLRQAASAIRHHNHRIRIKTISLFTIFNLIHI